MIRKCLFALDLIILLTNLFEACSSNAIVFDDEQIGYLSIDRRGGALMPAVLPAVQLV